MATCAAEGRGTNPDSVPFGDTCGRVALTASRSDPCTDGRRQSPIETVDRVPSFPNEKEGDTDAPDFLNLKSASCVIISASGAMNSQGLVELPLDSSFRLPVGTEMRLNTVWACGAYSYFDRCDKTYRGVIRRKKAWVREKASSFVL